MIGPDDVRVTVADVTRALKHLGFDTVEDLHYWAMDDNELNRFDALCQQLAEHRTEATAEQARLLRIAEEALDALFHILVPAHMVIAQQECINEPLSRDAVIFSFMGSGASDQVTVGEFQDASNTARAALTEIRAALARGGGE